MKNLKLVETKTKMSDIETTIVNYIEVEKTKIT